MKTELFVFRGFTANSYLCRDEETGKCLVIDPGTDTEKAIEVFAPEKPDYILLTHGHFDHIAAADELRRACGAKIAIHKEDAALLADPKLNVSDLFWRGRAIRLCADVLLSDGDVLTLGKSVFSVLHTPGHTPGSACFLCGQDLFSGDTLFSGDFGRCDFPGGSEEKLCGSLKKLARLPGQTRVYPGHEEGTVLERERENIFRFCMNHGDSSIR